MTGYPWAVGDALLATDLNEAIANAGALSGSTNVLSFGATGDGVTDDTAAIRAAIGSGGKEVFFPAGTYKISGLPIVLPSRTRVTGAGREVSIIRPNGLAGYSGDAPTVFVGYLYSTTIPYTGPTTPPGGVYDTDIAIEGLGFDYTTQAATTASFLFVKNLDVAGLRMWATTSASCTGVRCISCDRVTMRDCVGDNVMQMLDCWAGTTRVKVSDVDVVMFPGGGNGGAFNLQGIGTTASIGKSWQYVATNINIWLNNGIGFFLDSGGDGSVVSDVLMENVMIVATGGATNKFIVGRGLGGRIKAHNVSCVAMDGAAWNNPVIFGGFFSNFAPEVGANKVATASGSNVLTVTFASGTDSGVGNYVNIDAGAGGPLVANGLTLTGAYKILSVVSTTGIYAAVVTCDARANASASGSIAASTRIVGYLGSFRDCEFSGLTFDGAQAAGAPLISVAGYGHQFSDINVTTNYGVGFTTPRYSELFSTDISNEPDVTQRPVSVNGVAGAPGAGPVRAGYSGTSFISWNGNGPTPTLGLTGNPIAKPTVTGAKGGNAALASLLTALAAYGLVTDSTT